MKNRPTTGRFFFNISRFLSIVLYVYIAYNTVTLIVFGTRRPVRSVCLPAFFGLRVDSRLIHG
jgi:hypothetical protein